jgi:hypothetical protein
MSQTQFANNDISRTHEWFKKIEYELLALKMEKKIANSAAMSIIDSGISKDGDVIKASLVVPTGKKVIFFFGFDSLYEDFTSTTYTQGDNSSFLTAESSYLLWQILGICNDTVFNAVQLSFTAGSKRTYKTKSVYTAGSYSDLQLYARVEEQNSTPEYRCALYWATWVAVEVNV